MSVLTELFEAASRFHYSQFVEMTDDLVPFSLLDFAELPEGTLRGRAGAIRKALASGVGRHTANPEIFPPLHRLAAGEDAAAVEADLRLLELHLGLLAPDALSGFPDGCYRLTDTAGEVFRVDRGEVRVITPRPVAGIPGLRPGIYLPLPGLFRDLLPEAQYPSCDDTAGWERAVEPIAAAARLVRAYSPELFEDFERIVRWIALLPSGSHLLSTSLQLGYFRAIFINTFDAGGDTALLAEQLIHEYLHLRMRQWWFYEPVEGLPDDDAVIVSPVSGQRRPVPVMLQGYVIYLEALRFHTWISDTRLPERDLAAARAAMLRRKAPPLAPALRQFAPPGTAYSEQLDFLDQELDRAVAGGAALVGAAAPTA